MFEGDFMKLHAITDKFKKPNLGGWNLWSDVWVREGWRVQERAIDVPARVLNMNSIVFTGNKIACLNFAQEHAPALSAEHVVVLLHGLGCGRGIMNRLERGFQAKGFGTANVGYPSLLKPIEYHAQALNSVVSALRVSGAKTISIVAHSLGGLIALVAMADEPTLWTDASMVLIGSPVRGSRVAEVMMKFKPFRMLVGKCGEQLIVGSVLNSIPEIPTCVIAGGNNGNGFNPFMGEDNDGTVLVSETHLTGAIEFYLFPSLHSMLPRNSKVIDRAIKFVKGEKP
jgi:hypothetical protein